jgi:uncharacterized protein (DUF169 family)
LRHIPELMDKGRPVSVLFTEEKGNDSDLLYCELVQRARYGESFLVKSQGCSVGAFVLGDTETSPEDYYFSSNRYGSRNAAKTAASGLCRLTKKGCSIKITPYSGGDFDVLLLFLKPERAMRLIQAYTYTNGSPVDIRTGGIASVCNDCTAYPMQDKLGISLGCKGSRKHSRYSEDELVVGIPFQLARGIDAALGKILKTVE